MEHEIQKAIYCASLQALKIVLWKVFPMSLMIINTMYLHSVLDLHLRSTLSILPPKIHDKQDKDLEKYYDMMTSKFKWDHFDDFQTLCRMTLIASSPKHFCMIFPAPTSEQLMILLENFSLKIARLEGFYFYLVAQIFVCLLWRNMRLSLKQDFDNTCQRKISVPRILYDLCQLTIYPCKQHNHYVWKSPKIALTALTFFFKFLNFCL